MTMMPWEMAQVARRAKVESTARLVREELLGHGWAEDDGLLSKGPHVAGIDLDGGRLRVQVANRLLPTRRLLDATFDGDVSVATMVGVVESVTDR